MTSNPHPNPLTLTLALAASRHPNRVQAMQSGCDRSGRQFDMLVAALFRVMG